jgi:hypothetical protein
VQVHRAVMALVARGAMRLLDSQVDAVLDDGFASARFARRETGARASVDHLTRPYAG